MVGSGTGTKRLLLGIEVTIFGGVLTLSASSSGAAIGLIVAVAGLLIALSGMAPETPA